MKNNFFIKVTILLLLVTSYFGFIKPSLAQSPTPSPETDIEVDPDVVKQNIQKRIQDAVEDKKDVIDEVLGEKSNVKKAWLGTLESLANATLTLKTDSTTRLASISAQTTIIRNDETSSLEDLSLGDYLIVMGYINGNEVLDARRIVASSTAPEMPKHQSFFGQIVDIDTERDTLAVKRPQNNQQTTFELTSKSILNLKTNSDPESIELADLSPNQLITIIYLPPEKNSLPTLVQALALPSPEPNPDQQATESAEINPSPAPKPTPKTTPAEIRD